MLRTKKSGFTLIELMVVIVIIGVLASLAIPRFSEASDKAKVAEAPRIIASYESAYLAAVAEVGFSGITNQTNDIVFDVDAVQRDSKWFNYTYVGTTGMTAQPSNNIGKFEKCILTASYVETQTGFVRAAQTETIAKRYVPNFFK